MLPRPAVRKVQLARTIIRPLWGLWKWALNRGSRIDRSEARLAAFIERVLRSEKFGSDVVHVASIPGQPPSYAGFGRPLPDPVRHRYSVAKPPQPTAAERPPMLENPWLSSSTTVILRPS